MLSDSLKQLLSADLKNNISILCLAGEYPLIFTQQQENMLMCCFRTDRDWCYFSYRSSPEFVDHFLSQTPKSPFIVVDGEELCHWVENNYNIEWKITCIRLFQDEDFENLFYPEVKAIQPKHLDCVYNTSDYQQFLSPDYLSERLILGGGYCIVSQNRPVAWIMTHDDGSVGMLHVLEEFRHRGLARKLVQAMSLKVKQKGRPVFAHIEPENLPSLNLFRSLGYSDYNYMTWMKISGKA